MSKNVRIDSLSRCAYVMLCESDENRILAEFMLSTIMRFFLEYVTSHEQGNAEVSIIINHDQTDARVSE